MYRIAKLFGPQLAVLTICMIFTADTMVPIAEPSTFAAHIDYTHATIKYILPTREINTYFCVSFKVASQLFQILSWSSRVEFEGNYMYGFQQEYKTYIHK